MDTLKRWILPIGVILCGTVLAPMAYDKALTSRHLIWCAMTIALVLCTKRIRVGKIHVFALGYLFFVLLSGMFAINKSEWLYWLLRVVLVVSYLSVVEIDKKLLTKAMIVLGMIFIGYFWYDYFNVRELSGCRGLMMQRNTWAAAHFFIIPFCYYAIQERFWRKLSLLVMLAMATNIILLSSRSSMLALVVSVFVVLLTKNRLYVVSITTVCVVSILYFYGDRILRDDSIYTRLIQWKPTLKMIVDNPLGVGAGNWWIEFPHYAPDIDYAQAYDRETFRFPHNDFLWIWAEVGVGGLVCYLGMFCYSLYCAWKEKAVYLLVGLLGYMSIAFFSAPRARPFASLILITFIAMACPMRSIQQPRILLTFLIFAMIVFGFRFRSSCWDKKLKSAKTISQRVEATRGFSVFSTLLNNSQPWHWVRGVMSLEMNKRSLAIEQLEKAYEYNPYSIFVLNGMGLARQFEGNNKQANTFFDKALEICPDFEAAKINKVRYGK